MFYIQYASNNVCVVQQWILKHREVKICNFERMERLEIRQVYNDQLFRSELKLKLRHWKNDIISFGVTHSIRLKHIAGVSDYAVTSSGNTGSRERERV